MWPWNGTVFQPRYQFMTGFNSPYPDNFPNEMKEFWIEVAISIYLQLNYYYENNIFEIISNMFVIVSNPCELFDGKLAEKGP